MKKLLALAALSGMLVCGKFVLADDIIGEWVSTPEVSHGALSGLTHHGTRPAGEHFTHKDMVFTLTITSREGNGFHGEWCSTKMCEKLVGVIRRDKTMLMVDEDSTFFGTMYGNEMELCVTEPGEDFLLATCLMMKRK